MPDESPATQPVKAQLVITLFDAAGQAGQLQINTSGDFNEVNARFMLDKARAILDDHWRVQAAPRVIPGGLNGLPEALRRHLKRG